MDLKDPDIIALLASQAGVLKFFTLLFPGFFALLVYVPAAPNDACCFALDAGQRDVVQR